MTSRRFSGDEAVTDWRKTASFSEVCLAEAPMLPAALGLIVGIFSAGQIFQDHRRWILISAAVFIALAILLWLSKHYRFSITALFVTLGLTLGWYRLPLPLPAWADGYPGLVTGHVSEVHLRGNITILTLSDCHFSAEKPAGNQSSPYPAQSVPKSGAGTTAASTAAGNRPTVSSDKARHRQGENRAQVQADDGRHCQSGNRKLGKSDKSLSPSPLSPARPLERCKVAVQVFNLENPPQTGDRVAFRGTLQSGDDEHLRHGRAYGLPFAPDFAAGARASGITARMSARPADYAFIRREPSGSELIFASWHRALTSAVFNAGFDMPTTAFVTRALAGDRDIFDDETQTDTFRIAGVAHILALSGMHVGIVAAIAAMLFFLVRPLPAGRFLYMLLMSAAVVAYTCAVGMPASAARAAVMFIVGAFAVFVCGYRSVYNALCVTVAVWLIISPAWLWSAAMHLSCAAVAGMALLAGYITVDPAAHPVRYRLTLLVAVPVFCALSTSLLTVAYFHYLPVWFLPANLVVSLLAPPLLLVAAVATGIALAFGPGLTAVPAAIANILFAAMDRSVAAIAALPASTALQGLYPSTVQFLAAILVLACIVWRAHDHRPRATAAVIASVFLLGMTVILRPAPPRLEAYIPCDPSATTVIVGCGPQLTAYCDGDSLNRSQLSDYTAGLQRRRGCQSLTFASGTVLDIGGRTLTVLQPQTATGLHSIPNPARITWLVVAGTYRGDIVADVSALQPDTVILPRALNYRLRDRYCRLLQQACFTVVNAADQPWSYIIEN